VKTISAFALVTALVAGTPAFAHMSGPHQMNQSMTDGGRDDHRKFSFNEDRKDDKARNGENHKASINRLNRLNAELIVKYLILHGKLMKLQEMGEVSHRTERLAREVQKVQIELNEVNALLHPNA
jgi:hypothetical protein